MPPGIDSWQKSPARRAVMLYACTQCGAAEGQQCTGVDGTAYWPPHLKRMECLSMADWLAMDKGGLLYQGYLDIEER